MMAIKPANLIPRTALNRASRFFPGLNFAYYFGSTLENLVGNALTVDGAAYSWVDTIEGRAVRLNTGDATTTRLRMVNERAVSIADKQDFTVAVRFATTDNYAPLLSLRNAGDDNPIIDLFVGYNGVTDAPGKALAIFRGNGTSLSNSNATYANTVNDGLIHTLAVRREANDMQISLDGGFWAAFGSTPSNSIAATFTADMCSIGAESKWIAAAYATLDQRYADATIFCAAMWSRALSDADIAAFHADPYGLVRVRKAQGLATGGATTLQGAAAAQASASAALTTQIPLAGVAVSVATASGSITTAIPLAATAQAGAAASAALSSGIPLAGAASGAAGGSAALTTQIPLAASAASVSTAAGALTTSIALSGAALAQALAAAGMDTSILLAASAQGQASATGDLAGAAQLAANAQASAGAAASLTIQIRLAGDALAQAFASGDLTTGGAGALAADAQAFASASGALLTAIPLLGAALSTASASGNIITMIPLQGAAAVVASGVGSLTASITLGAQAAAQALASGALTATIRLDAAAVAEAAASGALGSESAAATPLARILRIAREDRALRVAKEDRTLRISA